MRILILLAVLVGCVGQPDKPKVTAKMGYCRMLQELGYVIVEKACDAHMKNPKYKLAQTVKVPNTIYASTCRFTIRRPSWAHGDIENIPTYKGDVACKVNGQMKIIDEDITLEETDLGL